MPQYEGTVIGIRTKEDLERIERCFVESNDRLGLFIVLRLSSKGACPSIWQVLSMGPGGLSKDYCVDALSE